MAATRWGARSRRGAALVVAAAALLGPGIVSAGPSGGALPPELVRVLDVTSLDDVPDDAAMVAVNITATRAAGKGYFTAYACDQSLPDASNVNYLADTTVPNSALVRLAAEGTVCIATSEVSDLIVDVIGYVPTTSSIEPIATPLRVTDTRDTTTLAAGETVEVPVHGIGGIVTDATVVMANVTAISRGGTGFLTVHPCSPEVPDTSSLNYGPGQVAANFVISRIGPDGTICVTTSQPADVIVDLAASAVDGITPLPEPVRLVDTRDTTTVTDRLQLDIGGRTDVPDTATAAVYNLTAARASTKGFATSHPCLTTAPTASNLNYTPGPPVANGTITKLSDTGHLCIDVSTPTDLIVDLIAYTTDTTHYIPITPTRIEDTRQGWQRTCDWVIADPTPSRVVLLNVTTHEERIVQATTSLASVAGPRLTADCDGLLLYVNSSLADGGTWRIPFEGAVERIPAPASLEFLTMSTVFDLDGSMLLGDQAARLFDPTTGDVVWPGTTTPEMVEVLDVARDGTVALLYTLQDDPSNPIAVIETWSAATDTQLGRIEVPGMGVTIGLSGDGTYVAIGYQDDGESIASVWTVFGSPVDGWIAPIQIRPSFAGTGSLLLCANFNGVYEWQLFGDLTKVVDWPTYAAASGGQCTSFRQ